MNPACRTQQRQRLGSEKLLILSFVLAGLRREYAPLAVVTTATQRHSERGNHARHWILSVIASCFILYIWYVMFDVVHAEWGFGAAVGFRLFLIWIVTGRNKWTPRDVGYDCRAIHENLEGVLDLEQCLFDESVFCSDYTLNLVVFERESSPLSQFLKDFLVKKLPVRSLFADLIGWDVVVDLDEALMARRQVVLDDFGCQGSICEIPVQVSLDLWNWHLVHKYVHFMELILTQLIFNYHHLRKASLLLHVRFT